MTLKSQTSLGRILDSSLVLASLSSNSCAEESGVNVLIHGQETKQLEKTLDELSQHQNAPGLMRMISPLGCQSG
jgi:hypothetical protein